AASLRRMHYCFLGPRDLVRSDDYIRSKIADARKLWKYRALDGIPEHGFMLSICDRRVAYAQPDEALLEFALHVQRLAGWQGRLDCRGNEIVDEWVYLRHPSTEDVVKFTFSVDFFASAADGKWWHDHRVPGGIAFTANSLGHMARWMEWYDGKGG